LPSAFSAHQAPPPSESKRKLASEQSLCVADALAAESGTTAVAAVRPTSEYASQRGSTSTAQSSRPSSLPSGPGKSTPASSA